MVSEVHDPSGQDSYGIGPGIDKEQERPARIVQWQAGYGRQAGMADVYIRDVAEGAPRGAGSWD